MNAATKYIQDRNINVTWDPLIVYCVNSWAIPVIFNREPSVDEIDAYRGIKYVDEKLNVPPIAQYNAIKLKDLSGDYREVTYNELLSAMLCMRVVVLNLTLSYNGPMQNRQGIVTTSLEQTNKIANRYSGLSICIGNKKSGFFEIEWQDLIGYYGTSETVQIPNNLSNISEDAFFANRHTKTVIVHGDCQYIHSFGEKSHIEKIVLKHDFKELDNLIISGAYFASGNGLILNGKPSIEIYIEAANLAVYNAHDLLNMIKHKLTPRNILKMHGGKLNNNDQLCNYITKSAMMGIDDIEINLVRRELVKMSISKQIAKLVLPPVRRIKYNAFDINYNKDPSIDTLILPEELEDEELLSNRLPCFTHQMQSSDGNTINYYESLSQKIVIPKNSKVKFITGFDVPAMVQNRLGTNTSDKLPADIEQKGMKIKIIGITEINNKKRCVIADESDNRKVVYMNDIIDKMLEQRVQLTNAVLCVDREIRILK